MTEFKLPPRGEDELTDRVRDALGAADDEEIIAVTPHFNREIGEPAPPPAPRDRAWWDDLGGLDYYALREMGCRPWNDPDDPAEPFGGRVLMLLPGEWYASIPEGFDVVDILGESAPFRPGVTDDDIRGGCLPYGLVVDAPAGRP